MTEEIIAYRIHEGLFCPDCYEKTAKTLKAVQNPEDPQVTLPAKPIRKEDIYIFACNQCGVVKGSVGKKSNTQAEQKGDEISLPPKKIIEPRRRTLPAKREAEDLVDVEETIMDCGYKLALLQDLFAQPPIDYEPEISEDGYSGLRVILDEVKDDLDFSVNEIDRMRKKGLIIEKEK